MADSTGRLVGWMMAWLVAGLVAPAWAESDKDEPTEPTETVVSPMVERMDFDRVSAILAQPVQAIELDETPLLEAIDLFADQLGISIVIDRVPVVELGVNLDIAITARIDRVSNETALRLVLRMVGLDVAAMDGYLLITTPAVLEQMRVIRTYDLRHVFEGLEPEIRQADEQLLINTIQATITPEAWLPPRTADPNRKDATVQFLGGMLIMRHHPNAHRELADLLKQLRPILAR